jgi:hypothetical protein
VLRTNPLRKKEGTEVAKGKKKTSARKPYTAADVKLLKQHSKGKNARAEDCIRQKAQKLGIGLGHQR